MADKSTPTTEIRITPEQLRDLLLEVKKPYIDEEAQARIEKRRQQLRAQHQENERMRRLREQSCTHLRHNGTSTIAWLTTPDWEERPFTRGVCQRCLKLFLPGDPDYVKMRNTPAGVDGFIF